MKGINTAMVTGASGFIGMTLCRRLVEHGVRVVGLMRHPVGGPRERRICVSLPAESIPPESLEGIDTVFHLAGKAHAIEEVGANDDDYQCANTDATEVVLNAALAAGVKQFVFFSTVKAMGDEPGRCMDETSTLLPDSPYGRSKRLAEGLVLAAGSSGDLHATVLRLPLVYGPGVKGNFGVMVKAIARNRFPPIQVRNNKRSMVHVDDVVRAAMMVAVTQRAAGEVFIVTDGEPYSTSELFELMCTALAKPIPRWHVPVGLLKLTARFGDFYGWVSGRRFIFDSATITRLTSSAWFSSRKIELELGFCPERRLETSLAPIVKQIMNERPTEFAKGG